MNKRFTCEINAQTTVTQYVFIHNNKRNIFFKFTAFLHKQETNRSLTPSSTKSDFISFLDSNNQAKATKEIDLSQSPLTRDLKKSLPSKQYQFGLLRFPSRDSPVCPPEGVRSMLRQYPTSDKSISPYQTARSRV